MSSTHDDRHSGRARVRDKFSVGSGRLQMEAFATPASEKNTAEADQLFCGEES